MQKRKNKGGCISIFVLALIQIMPANASRSNSVMLSTSELDTIGLRKTPGLKNGEVRLDGILYRSETEWTIWLNGQPYTPKYHPDNIVILEVTPHRVEIKREENKSPNLPDREEKEEDKEIFDPEREDYEEEEGLDLPVREKTYSLTIDQVVKLN